MRRFRFLIVLMALVAGSCGGAETADTTEATSAGTAASPATSTTTTQAETTTTSAAETTTTTEAAVTTTVAETTTTTVAETTTTTEASADVAAAPAGTVVITADDGVYVVTPDGAANQLMSYDPAPEFPADRIDFAISDTRGGIIIQPNRQPWFYKGTDSIIYWVPFGGSAPQQLLVSAADQGIQLEDVVIEGPSTNVYYTRLEGSLPEDMLQTLRRFDLDTKTVTPLADVAGWESGAWNFSVGGLLIVHQWSGEGWSGFQFRDIGDGSPNVWAGDPTAGGEFDCYPECHVGVAVSPGGHQVAWAQRQAGTWWVTITDVEFGDVVANFTLPDGGWEIHSIDLGDDYLVVNRQEEGNEWYIRPLLVDIDQGSLGVTEIPFEGLARLTDVIPQLNGVVTYP